MKKLLSLNYTDINPLQDSGLLTRVVLLLVLVITMVTYYSYRQSEPTSQIKANDSKTQVMSKEAVEALVKSAADKKYIEDVLNGATNTLPKSSHPVPLQPLLANGRSTTIAVDTNPAVQPVQRCSYSGQLYVTGDMVKTQQGWVRCMPTLVFSSEKNERQEYGMAAWIKVQ